MNDARRKEIERALTLIGEAKGVLKVALSQEQDDLDNMPEDLQGDEEGQRAEDVIDALERAAMGCGDALPPAKRRCRVSTLVRAKGYAALMGIIRWLFGAAPPDAKKLDGTTTATLARSLSALPADERGWITFVEARSLFSTKGDQYAFGETDDDGRKNIESFAAEHQSVINFMPIEQRVYFLRRRMLNE